MEKTKIEKKNENENEKEKKEKSDNEDSTLGKQLMRLTELLTKLLNFGQKKKR